MKKIIFLMILITAAALFSCADMVSDVSNPYPEDKSTGKWDSSVWDVAKWGD